MISSTEWRLVDSPKREFIRRHSVVLGYEQQVIFFGDLVNM